MSIMEIAQSIEMSAMSTALRGSAYAYPLIEGTHVLSLSMAVGMIIWFDLRLLGVTFRTEPIRALYDSLRPWLLTGFLLMGITGILLLLTRPAHIIENVYFQIKMVLLLLCMANILVYHFIVEKGSPAWNSAAVPPAGVRVVGGLSLLLWFSVIAVGRIMAYSL